MKSAHSKTLPSIPEVILYFVIACFIVCMITACQTETIFVPDGAPVRLREPIKGAAVWVQNENGAWVEGTVDLPAGWYALSDPTEGGL